MVKKIVKDFLYERESYLIRGAIFEVWRAFKGIFKEKIAENALKKELQNFGLGIESQKRIPIYYKGEKVGTYTPDQIVNGAILIEIKVKPYLTKEDERQFWYYLRGSQYRLGFLINFGSKKLEIKRRIYDKAREKYKSIEADRRRLSTPNNADVSVNQRSYQRISASTNKGFTLIELLVSIFIIVLISGIILANYRVSGQQFALQRSANKLAQDIRRAQQMAMGAAEHAGCPAGYKYGYGIYLTTSANNQYILFADCDNWKDYDSGEGVETIKLETGVKIKTLSGNPLTITFTPPDPTITISPSAPASIQLGNDSQTKTITVNSAGLIGIQ